jgi:hypothetical protein
MEWMQERNMLHEVDGVYFPKSSRKWCKVHVSSAEKRDELLEIHQTEDAASDSPDPHRVIVLGPNSKQDRSELLALEGQHQGLLGEDGEAGAVQGASAKRSKREGARAEEEEEEEQEGEEEDDVLAEAVNAMLVRKEGIEVKSMRKALAPMLKSKSAPQADDADGM